MWAACQAGENPYVHTRLNPHRSHNQFCPNRACPARGQGGAEEETRGMTPGSGWYANCSCLQSERTGATLENHGVCAWQYPWRKTMATPQRSPHTVTPDALTSYLAEVRRKPLLSPAEETEL